MKKLCSRPTLPVLPAAADSSLPDDQPSYLAGFLSDEVSEPPGWARQINRIDELLTEQRKTNCLLQKLSERGSFAPPPIDREPTVDEELAACRAQGVSLADYLIQKYRYGKYNRKSKKNGPRMSSKKSEMLKEERP